MGRTQSENAYAEVDAIAAAAKGEIGGYAGAVGVEGFAGMKDGVFELRGGAAAVLGVSAGFSIGFDPDGFVDSMKAIGTGVKGIWDSIWNW